jgi:hypothetical protein
MGPIPSLVKGGRANSAPDPPALPTSSRGPGDNSAAATTRWRGRPFRRKRPTWQGPRVAAPKCRRWRRNSRERGRSMDELRVAQERELEALQRATEMGRWPRRNRRSASAEQRQNDTPERLTDHGLGAYRTAPTCAPSNAFYWPLRIRGSGAGRDTPDPSIWRRRLSPAGRVSVCRSVLALPRPAFRGRGPADQA